MLTQLELCIPLLTCSLLAVNSAERFADEGAKRHVLGHHHDYGYHNYYGYHN